jgi:hypothetical protein
MRRAIHSAKIDKTIRARADNFLTRGASKLSAARRQCTQSACAVLAILPRRHAGASRSYRRSARSRRPCLELNPSFTIARFRSQPHSDHLVYLAAASAGTKACTRAGYQWMSAVTGRPPSRGIGEVLRRRIRRAFVEFGDELRLAARLVRRGGICSMAGTRAVDHFDTGNCCFGR